MEHPQNVPPPLPPMKGEELKLAVPPLRKKEVMTPLTMRQAIFESVMQELDANIAAAVLDLPGFVVRCAVLGSFPYRMSCDDDYLS